VSCDTLSAKTVMSARAFCCLTEALEDIDHAESRFTSTDPRLRLALNRAGDVDVRPYQKRIP